MKLLCYCTLLVKFCLLLLLSSCSINAKKQQQINVVIPDEEHSEKAQQPSLSMKSQKSVRLRTQQQQQQSGQQQQQQQHKRQLLSSTTQGQLSMGYIKKKVPTNDTYCTNDQDRLALEDWLALCLMMLFPFQFNNTYNINLGMYFEDGTFDDFFNDDDDFFNDDFFNDDFFNRKLSATTEDNKHRELQPEWCTEFCAQPGNRQVCVLAGCPGSRRRRHNRRSRALRESSNHHHERRRLVFDYNSILSGFQTLSGQSLESSCNYADVTDNKIHHYIPPFLPGSFECLISPGGPDCDCDPSTMEFVAYYYLI